MQRNDRIGRQLKLKDLHTFREVVQRGSMAKAATELALTPPAITNCSVCVSWNAHRRV
jgi:hypothetical protein